MYLRKSRADEELGYENTLERHEEMLRNLAAQTGIHVDEAHIFREIVSGESIEARPQMQKLLKAVEMGLYTGVLCRRNWNANRSCSLITTRHQKMTPEETKSKCSGTNSARSR